MGPGIHLKKALERDSWCLKESIPQGREENAGSILVGSSGLLRTLRERFGLRHEKLLKTMVQGD